jgi:exonuclease VII small subunit
VPAPTVVLDEPPNDVDRDAAEKLQKYVGKLRAKTALLQAPNQHWEDRMLLWSRGEELVAYLTRKRDYFMPRLRAVGLVAASQEVELEEALKAWTKGKKASGAKPVGP